MMSGIVAKYFPKCYSFDEQELNRILSAALVARECRQMIESIRNVEASQGKDEETRADIIRSAGVSGGRKKFNENAIGKLV